MVVNKFDSLEREPFKNYFINLYKREQGFTKRPLYLKKLIEKGKVRCSNSTQTNSTRAMTLGDLKNLIPIITAFQENKTEWSFYFRWEETLEKPVFLGIMTYLPKITIANSEKHKHTIYDCFITYRISCEDNLAHIHHFDFSKTTYSFKELVGNYVYIHSHVESTNKVEALSLQTLYSGDFSRNICKGSSSISFQEIGTAKTLEEYLYSFVNIEGFFKWESLEGGPYYNIKALEGNLEKATYPISDLKIFFTYYADKRGSILPILKILVRHFNLFVTHTYNFNFKYSEEFFIEFFTEILEENSSFLEDASEQSKKLIDDLQEISRNNSSEIITTEFKREFDFTERQLIFKDRTYEFKIRKRESIHQIKQTSNYFLSPRVKKLIIEKINTILNDYQSQISNYTVAITDTSDYT